MHVVNHWHLQYGTYSYFSHGLSVNRVRLFQMLHAAPQKTKPFPHLWMICTWQFFVTFFGCLSNPFHRFLVTFSEGIKRWTLNFYPPNLSLQLFYRFFLPAVISNHLQQVKPFFASTGKRRKSSHMRRMEGLKLNIDELVSCFSERSLGILYNLAAEREPWDGQRCP